MNTFRSDFMVGAVVVGLSSPVTVLAQSSEAARPEIEEIVVTAQRRDESLARTPVAVSVLSAEALQTRAVFSETDLQRTVPGLMVRATQNANQLNFSIRGQTVDAFSGSSSAVVSYFNEVPIAPNSSTQFFDLQSVQVLKGPQGTLFGENTTGGAVLFKTAEPTDQSEGYLTARYGRYETANVEGALNIPIAEDRAALRLAGTYRHSEGFTFNEFDQTHVGGADGYAARLSLLTRFTDNLSNTLVANYDHQDSTNTPNVAYSAYAPGDTNNGIPLEGIGGLLFSPALDAVVGAPGAWSAYLAAHPHADPGGLAAFVESQRERGPYVASLDGSLAHKTQQRIVANTTSLKLSDSVTIKNIFGYGSFDTFDGADFDGTSFGIESLGHPSSPLPWGYKLEGRKITDELQAIGSTGEGQLQYVIGLFYSDYTLKTPRDAVTVFDLSPIIPATLQQIPGEISSKSYAAYAQFDYDLSELTGVEGLGIVAGGRYTVAEPGLEIPPEHPSFGRPGFSSSLSDTEREPSYQFGVNYQLNPELMLYAVTRRSFRAGGFNLLAPTRGGTAAEGGAAFKSEIAQDVEVGLKFQGYVGSMPLRLNAAVYDQWVDDIQRTTYATVPGVGLASLTVNVPQAEMRGVEIDLQVSPVEWLELGAAFAYTDAEFTRNESEVFGVVTRYGPYPDTPETSGSVFAQLSLPLGTSGTYMNLRGDVYSQEQFYFSSTADTVSPETDLPSYTLVNFRIALDNIGGKGVSIAAVGRNLTDEVYYVGGVPVGQIVSVNSATPGEPRTYFVEVSYKY